MAFSKDFFVPFPQGTSGCSLPFIELCKVSAKCGIIPSSINDRKASVVSKLGSFEPKRMMGEWFKRVGVKQDGGVVRLDSSKVGYACLRICQSPGDICYASVKSPFDRSICLQPECICCLRNQDQWLRSRTSALSDNLGLRSSPFCLQIFCVR